jgi:hypothetical protein
MRYIEVALRSPPVSPPHHARMSTMSLPVGVVAFDAVVPILRTSFGRNNNGGIFAFFGQLFGRRENRRGFTTWRGA